MKAGSDKRPPKAVALRGVRGHALPENFNFRASELQIPVFSGELVHFF